MSATESATEVKTSGFALLFPGEKGEYEVGVKEKASVVAYFGYRLEKRSKKLGTWPSDLRRRLEMDNNPFEIELIFHAFREACIKYGVVTHIPKIMWLEFRIAAIAFAMGRDYYVKLNDPEMTPKFFDGLTELMGDEAAIQLGQTEVDKHKEPAIVLVAPVPSRTPKKLSHQKNCKRKPNNHNMKVPELPCPLREETTVSETATHPLVLPGKDMFQLECVESCLLCHEEFNGDTLANKEAVMLPCGHGKHAICCICLYRFKVHHDVDKPANRLSLMRCPLCPDVIVSDMWVQDVPRQMVYQDVNILKRLESLCLDVEVASRLLWTHKFNMSLVQKQLDSMMGLSYSSEEMSKLFTSVHQEISSFREQRDYLRKQLENLRMNKLEETDKFVKAISCVTAQLDACKWNSEARKLRERRTELFQRVEELRKKTFEETQKLHSEISHVNASLLEAQQRASNEAFKLLNKNPGIPGASKIFQLDFHCQKLKAVKRLFNDQVLPVIMSGFEVRVITGLGRHSPSREAQIKNYLVGWLTTHNEIGFRQPKDNQGALDVYWKHLPSVPMTFTGNTH